MILLENKITTLDDQHSEMIKDNIIYKLSNWVCPNHYQTIVN